MDLATACPLCGRAVGNTGYLVVERAYWYHECPALTAQPSTPTIAGRAAAPTIPAGGRPTLAETLFQPRLRLSISPVTSTSVIQQFCAELERFPAVRGIDLEQFIGQMAVLDVEASSLSDLIAALLALRELPVSGLTVTADGQISARLDEQAIERRAGIRFTPPSAPMASPPPAPTTAPPRDALAELQERLQQLSRGLADLTGRPAASAPAAQTTQAPTADPRERLHELTGRIAALKQRGEGPTSTEEQAATPAVGAAVATAPQQTEAQPLPADGDHPAPSALAGAQPAGKAVEREPATQSIQVVAYPFENFSSVNSFINAIRTLPDVRYVAPRRFRAGTIQLAVDYAGALPLSDRIRGLETFAPQIVNESEDTITVAIGGAR